MLQSSMLVGLGVVAFWFYLRYPRRRPGTLVSAAIHVAVSFVAFALLPTVLGLLLPVLPVPAPYIVLTLLLPSLTYLLLSWVWLIARVLDLFGGTPRGGHPAGTDH